MISFKLSELAVFGNYLLKGNDLEISSVSTDSRACRDALFVALIGERFDAHDFIEKAIENGAVAVLASRKLPEQIENRAAVIYCDDTQRAFGICGYLVRRKFKGTVASLTGSCGKTTVKEFTNSILLENGSSMCTEGNFNNDIGVPKTLLRLDNSFRFAVIEQGASHLFDNAHTCEFVKADTALINNIGGAHIEGFGSFDGIYRGKSQIIDDVLSRGGMAAVPSDDDYYRRWESDYKASIRDGRLVSFGSHDFDLVQYMNVKTSKDGLDFTLRADTKTFDVHMNVLGEHNAKNAAAACALALISGADVNTLASGLNRASTLKGRLSLKKMSNYCVIDDAYNASFNAVIAAIDTLSSLDGHRVLVFGDMGELGSEAESLHAKVGEYAKGRIDELLCLGKLTQYTVNAFDGSSKHFNLHEDLIQYAQNLIKMQEYTSFLVKGSHSMHMDKVSEALTCCEE